MPLIPALGRQRQVDLCEFKASLVYRACSRTARDGAGMFRGLENARSKAHPLP